MLSVKALLFEHLMQKLMLKISFFVSVVLWVLCNCFSECSWL